MAQKSGAVFQFGAKSGADGAAKPGIRTVLGAGCSVEGKLVCSGPTRLDGNVNGALVADEFLLIDRNSTITADLNVAELVVRGKVKGNIKAKKRVTLEGSAKVEGDIETPSINISDGAQVMGKVNVTRREDVSVEGVVRQFARKNEESDPAKTA